MTRNEFMLDFDRRERIGLSEAVFSAGKSTEQIIQILDAAAELHARLLLTRLDAERFAALPQRQRVRIDYDSVSRTGFFGGDPPARAEARVAIITAGTSDVPVGLEAARTLHFHGHDVRLFADVGVAGLWRLLRHIDDVAALPVAIVVAGMDAALPSVVGGLIGSVVIAVPTSIGYGVAEGGRTALNASLASCASGITVVNIDNGFGAACAALRMLNALDRSQGTGRMAEEGVSARQAVEPSA